MKRIFIYFTFLSVFLTVIGCQLRNQSPTAPGTQNAGAGPRDLTSPPVCTVTAVYSDNFSSDTLGNYDYFDSGTQATGTAAGEGYLISGGQLTNFLSTSPYGGIAVAKDALFSRSITDYTVEADFKISYLHSAGIFGLVFRTGNNGSFYSFQNDANTSNPSPGLPWELEKNTGSPSVEHTFVAHSNFTRGVNSGEWVHMKAVVLGNRFLCYLNYNDGVGDRLVMDATDTDAPYTSGGVGIRTLGGFLPPNAVFIQNFTVTGCAGNAPPPTVPPTPTATSIIPDPNLRQAILETLETATPNTTVTIDAGSLSTLPRLVADNNSVQGRIYPGWVSIAGPVTSLEGLEYCIRLQSLYLESNAITDLGPLANLTSSGNLQFLDLDYNNQLSDLSRISGFTSLTALELRSGAAEGDQYFPGSLTNLNPLSGLTHLQVLQISAQPVSSLAPVAGLTQLTRLYMIGLNNGNGPADGGIGALQNLTNLEILYASSNRISDASALSGLTQLQLADLSNNAITNTAPLSGLSGAATVILQYNSLSGSLPPLAGLGNGAIPLYLSLANNTDARNNPINDISNLCQIPGLKAPGAVLDITNETAIPPAQVSALQAADPQLTIVGP